MASIDCVECAGSVLFEEEVLQGEIVECPHCGVELEVIKVDPLEVDVAPETEEDWGE